MSNQRRWLRVGVAAIAIAASGAGCGGASEAQDGDASALASTVSSTVASDAGTATAAVLAPATAVPTALPSGVVKIMPLGDSITASCCYRDRLYRMLRDAGATVDFVGSVRHAAPAGQDWDHEGHGGYGVADVLKAAGTGSPDGPGYFADARDLAAWFGANAESPDVVLMHFGTNDRWGGVAAPTILRGYSAVLAAARARNPQVTFLVAQIIPMAVPGVDVRPLNDAIPAWAQANSTSSSRILVVDHHTGFDSAWTTDGVHPNATVGSQWIADRWMGALRGLLR